MERMSWLLTVLILALSFAYVYGQEVVCSPHNCIADQAICVNNNTCDCTAPYTWGEGNFACYRHNQVAAEVKNDPTLTTFNNETVKFDVPCRYLLASVKQQLKKRDGQVAGYCYFKVHAFHKRIKGKIVVDGIEIAVKFDLGYGIFKSLSILTYGQEGNVVEEGSDDDYRDYGPYGQDLTFGPVIYSNPIYNIYVRRYYDPDNRQYVFEVDNCGFRATFVPYDLDEGIRSPFIPGISVAVNCIYHPFWLDTEKVMALPPPKKGVPTLEELASHLGLTKQQAMAYRAFTSQVLQTQPNSCERCTNVSDSLAKCNATELIEAFDKCYFILNTSIFIRCLSPAYPDTSSEAHLSFFATCIEHYCDGFHQCAELQATPCTNGNLQSILTSTC